MCECGEGAPGAAAREKKKKRKQIAQTCAEARDERVQPGEERERGGASTGLARPWFRRTLSDSFGLENSGCRSSRVRSMVPLFKQSLGHGLKMKKSEKAQLHTLKYYIRDSTLLHNPSSGMIIMMGSGVLHAYLYTNTHNNIGVYGIHLCIIQCVCAYFLLTRKTRSHEIPTCRHGNSTSAYTIVLSM